MYECCSSREVERILQHGISLNSIYKDKEMDEALQNICLSVLQPASGFVIGNCTIVTTSASATSVYGGTCTFTLGIICCR